ncbi:MAG: hypothetical protein E5X48_07245 [Mesorhizobium sp.]|nr:MAG: hypothetical protein E5X48_07245 [Mesorhizobium sp.]
MTKLSDLGHPTVGKQDGTQAKNEADHFHPCPDCGQAVDCRDLRQVIRHEQPRHRPLKLDS